MNFGYEPLPVDESGQVKFQPNRRSRMPERGMQKLNESGIFGDVNSSLLGNHGRAGRAAAPGGVRGLTSMEAATIRESRDHYKRALNCGYLSVEDRYGSDVQFCDRVHQEGSTVKDCILDDMLAFANLPDPPRTRAQLSAGVATNAEHEHLLTKLVYLSHARRPVGFPHDFAPISQKFGDTCSADTCFWKATTSTT